MRKLAHIERIKDISPIYNKKGELMRNKCATVLGWQTMVRPDEFQVGDLVVYVEVDSIMPQKPEFEFLKKYNYRVKTQKFFQGSFVSQGLVLPLSILPQKTSIVEGKDVTKDLGITKHLTPSEREEEKQVNNKKKKTKLDKFMMQFAWYRKLFPNTKMKFPHWIPKTDEERLQNIPEVLDQFSDYEVYVTEKIDYQSATFTGRMIKRFKFLPFKKYQFLVCSRRLVNNNTNSLYWRIARKYNIEQILKENPHLTIQGEQGSPKIQGNKYGITEPQFWVFNIIDHDNNYHYNYSEMNAFCLYYDLNMVPILYNQYKLKELGTTVEDFVELSKGKSKINSDILREGIVVRCIKDGQRLLSFKVVNPDFLLKYGG